MKRRRAGLVNGEGLLLVMSVRFFECYGVLAHGGRRGEW